MRRIIIIVSILLLGPFTGIATACADGGDEPLTPEEIVLGVLLEELANQEGPPMPPTLAELLENYNPPPEEPVIASPNPCYELPDGSDYC